MIANIDYIIENKILRKTKRAQKVVKRWTSLTKNLLLDDVIEDRLLHQL